MDTIRSEWDFLLQSRPDRRSSDYEGSSPTGSSGSCRTCFNQNDNEILPPLTRIQRGTVQFLNGLCEGVLKEEFLKGSEGHSEKIVKSREKNEEVRQSTSPNLLNSLVELMGIEPTASWMPFMRSPSWATAPQNRNLTRRRGKCQNYWCPFLLFTPILLNLFYHNFIPVGRGMKKLGRGSFLCVKDKTDLAAPSDWLSHLSSIMTQEELDQTFSNIFNNIVRNTVKRFWLQT